MFGLPDVVTLVLVDQRLPRANAAKNMLLGASTVLAAAIYIIGGPVDWFAVVPLAVGLFAGSLGGPIIAGHAPALSCGSPSLRLGWSWRGTLAAHP